MLHVAAADGSRDQPTHQLPSHGRIAMRKMKNVRLLCFQRGEMETVEAWIGKGFVVGGIFGAGGRGHGLKPNGPEIMREGLEKRQRFGSDPAEFCEVVGVGDFRELG